MAKLNRQLQTAVLSNNERNVRKVIERGADVNALMASGYAIPGMAPLHHAVIQGSEGMVRLLVQEEGEEQEIICE